MQNHMSEFSGRMSEHLLGSLRATLWLTLAVVSSGFSTHEMLQHLQPHEKEDVLFTCKMISREFLHLPLITSFFFFFFSSDADMSPKE